MPTTVAMHVDVRLRGSDASSFIPILYLLAGGTGACQIQTHRTTRLLTALKGLLNQYLSNQLTVTNIGRFLLAVFPCHMMSEVGHLAVFLCHLTRNMPELSPQLFLAINMFTCCYLVLNCLLGRQPSYFTPCCGQTILRWQPSVSYAACCLH